MEGLRTFFDNDNDYEGMEVFNNWFITNESYNISEGKFVNFERISIL